MQEPNAYQKWLKKLNDSLRDMKSHELKQLVEALQKGEQKTHELIYHLTHLSGSFIHSLKHDLAHYREHQHEYDELAKAELIESIWYELSLIADRSQIEWHNLQSDFDHQGVYSTGDWVGLGEIVCQNCHWRLHIYHPTQLTECPECSGDCFSREALAP